ncbi:MAG: chromosomal replication initiator protein DnaA [Pirellulales bacterium]|nr:chromosomal replication initiator protein DnaA [Pirellulales bacterium]
MTRSDTDIVSALWRAIADRVGSERFDLWFGPGTRLDLAGTALTIGAPNPFYRDWLRANFRRQIEEAAAAVLGAAPEVEFRVEGDGPDAARASLRVVAAPAAQAADRAKSAGKEESATETKPAAQADASRPRRPAAERFETFVMGPSNQLARTAAEMVLREPGHYSPLLIHGATGVGKTHLLQSIHHAARRMRLGAAAVYVTAEQFTTYFLQALRGSGLPSFRQKYRGVQLLIVDDLQFFAGKRSTLVELHYTVDTLLRDRRQVVFAADRPLAELTDLGPELVSRMQGGIQCGVGRPEHATRAGIVAQLARRMGLDLPEDVRQFVAGRLTGHARELSGALCRLQAVSEAWRQPITLALAEAALAEMIRHSRRVVRLPDIQKAVCQTFGLEPASLASGGKSKHASYPRMLAMWLARKHTRAALSEIGHFFGRRSHSTVVSAQKRVDAWIASGTDVELADHTSTIDEAIRQVEQVLLAG